MQRVEIRVEGQIDETWSEWFEGFSVTHTEQNETILIGELPDQTALYGVITKLRDLGLKLISVIPLEGR
ncbi:MAG: hypothetical protein PVI99_04010 [Anaerolineales bacterium]|jgi:hypothetical protein